MGSRGGGEVEERARQVQSGRRHGQSRRQRGKEGNFGT